jgi:hypothetical protein
LAAKARVELEGEVSIDEMKQFWVGRGLKPHRARWLLKEAELEAKLRCPDLLQVTLAKLGKVRDCPSPTLRYLKKRIATACDETQIDVLEPDSDADDDICNDEL